MKMANSELLQVTITKITESEENKSTQRLDLSGSTGPGEGGGQLPPLPLGRGPPPPPKKKIK